jgi:hypothetical protein
MKSTRILGALCLPLLGIPSLAGPPAGESSKSGYHLFHPVPADRMRDLSTDRPDKTESPYTVDAGHVQVEMDLAAFTYDRHNSDRTDTRVESWSFGTVNLKFGLLNNVDFQVVIEPWSVSRTVERPGGRTRADGFGDVTLRTKVNLWGNDGGSTAFALMPFVKIPANQDDLGNHAVEGGLIVPLAVELPGGWGMGLMTEVDFNEDADGRGHHAEWINSITFSHDIVGSLGGYVEFFSAVTSERHAPWVATLDLGLTYAVTENVQLDAGVNLGLTRSADDVAPFVGLSVRF